MLRLLRHPSHAVARTVLDALGQIKIGTEAVLPEVRRLLTENNPEWERPLLRAWTGQDQVRLNAMMTLLRMGGASQEAEEIAAQALDDGCGYVGGFGTEFLLRRNTPTALRAALAYLQAHRWDNTLKRGVRTY